MRAPVRSTTCPSLRLVVFLTLFAPLSLSGASAASPKAKPAQAPVADAGTASAAVDCALPARIDRLSGQVIMLGARQVVQIAPEECRERGGEVVTEGAQVEPPAVESTD